MAAGETVGEPLEYGGCVFLLLDAEDGEKAPVFTLYKCMMNNGRPDEDPEATTCNFEAYNDEHRITTVVRDGSCMRATDGLRDELYVDTSAEQYWRAFRARSVGAHALLDETD